MCGQEMKWYVSMRAHVIWAVNFWIKVYYLKFFDAKVKIKNDCDSILQFGRASTHIDHGMMLVAHT